MGEPYKICDQCYGRYKYTEGHECTSVEDDILSELNTDIERIEATGCGFSPTIEGADRLIKIMGGKYETSVNDNIESVNYYMCLLALRKVFSERI
jgi:hypothetical protein